MLRASSSPGTAFAQTTIDPTHRHAFGANMGWLDFRAGSGSEGAILGEFVCSGKIYSANCGWISLGDGVPLDGFQYGNSSDGDYGVNHLGNGQLRGLAWGANIGWVNFESTGDPRIDLPTGDLGGHVWSANAGWISLHTASGHVRSTHLAAGADSDGDGLPDAWELTYTDTLPLLTSAADSDGDGTSNLAEYHAGTNPLDVSSVLRITAVAHDPASVQTTLTWTSSPTRLYRIAHCVALESPAGWLPNPLGFIVPESGTTSTRTTPAPAVTSSFFRVEAILPLSPAP